MNEKNSLGLDICFKDEDNPVNLFKEWFKKAETTEPNDPNALSLATAVANDNAFGSLGSVVSAFLNHSLKRFTGLSSSLKQISSPSEFFSFIILTK